MKRKIMKTNASKHGDFVRVKNADLFLEGGANQLDK